MIKIKYSRRAVCMGDDVMNDIYTIRMPKDSGLDDLLEILVHGGNGNNWPIPRYNRDWVIYSNIGIIAEITSNEKLISYIAGAEDTKLSSLGLKWVFGEFKGNVPDIASLEKLFSKCRV